MNLEPEVRYVVECKAITTEEWFNFSGYDFINLAKAKECKDAYQKKDPSIKLRVVRLTITREVVE